MDEAKKRDRKKPGRLSPRESVVWRPLADTVVRSMGSWTFIIVQSAFVVIWMGINIIGFLTGGSISFILLNLVFSTQAAYAAPSSCRARTASLGGTENMRSMITKIISPPKKRSNADGKLLRP